jgi:hypothetical protein
LGASTVFNWKAGQAVAIFVFALNRPVGTVRLRAFMRSAAVWLAGLINLLAAPAQCRLSKLVRTPLFGSDSLRPEDRAKIFDFQIHWTRQSEGVALTNAWARLVFTPDAQRAEINGLTEVLSASVPVRNGIGWIER